MAKLLVTDRRGDLHSLDIEPDRTIMEMLRDAGLGIEALCGGQGACATCHCYVEGDAYTQLPMPTRDEINLLGILDTYVPDRSRLTCQLKLDATLPDLTITIAPEG